MKKLSRWRPVVVLSLCACGTWLAGSGGCADSGPFFGPILSGPPNELSAPAGSASTSSSSSGSGDSGTPDLCSCGLTLATNACTACGVGIIAAGMVCEVIQKQCFGDTTCVSDAKCVGACTDDAGASDAGLLSAPCVAACIQAASPTYLQYLTCLCENCTAACSTTVTCP